MMLNLKASKSNPPVGALVTIESLKEELAVNVEWSNLTELKINNISISSVPTICRHFSRLAKNKNIYSENAVTRTEIDHWLSFSLASLNFHNELLSSLKYLNKMLLTSTYLVGNEITVADYSVWGALYTNSYWHGIYSKSLPDYTNVNRWYKFIGSQMEVKAVIDCLPSEAKTKPLEMPVATKAKTKDEGIFVDLPGAEMNKVVVRFPPEASGYLHVGHAKALLLNYHYRNFYSGKLIMRFDDTNPAKEKEEYEEVILNDMKMLNVKYDHFSHTSDHFQKILDYCEQLLKEGKAYVDDTNASDMKIEREQKIDSKNRNNPISKNVELFDEMKKGSEQGLKCCVRAKIDMQSVNGCMRDPTIYRCKLEPHPSTGTKYKVYPTYDFACPIVDSIEGVTHALRTTEYMDRDEQFNWFINALGIRKPNIYAYARLSLTNTVMSKRKLTWLVNEGYVDGWDDPRFPTVRGVIRRGLTVDALNQFILAQGSSRSVVFMEWDKIWAMNKKVIDPIAPRYTTIDENSNVIVNVQGVTESSTQAAKHPKNAELGTKTTWMSSQVLIDEEDAKTIKEGENATFINWGNLKIKKIEKCNGTIMSIDAEPNLDDKDYKKTVKLTWLAKTKQAKFIPTVCVYFDHIISKPVLSKDDDFKNFVSKDTRAEISMIGDPEMISLKKGDIVQIQRRGFFICDSAYEPITANSSRESPLILFSIPDGTPQSYGLPSKSNEKKMETALKLNKSKDKSIKDKISICAEDENSLNKKIVEQGDVVRKLKSEKASKENIDQAVKILLSLKFSYKEMFGKECKPGMKASAEQAASSKSDLNEINEQIKNQGDLVRSLKLNKADKQTIDAAVKDLLSFKSEFKKISGNDWTPEAVSKQKVQEKVKNSDGKSVCDINLKIIDQGNIVGQLKSEKKPKEEIDLAVKEFLALKASYKSITGNDWKPSSEPAEKNPATTATDKCKGTNEELNKKIVAQGDEVRKLKADKSEKAVIDEAVKILLSLKAEFKNVTGADWKPANTANTSKPTSSTSKKPEKSKQKTPPPAKEESGGKITRLGLEATKEENLPEWYSQVITKGEMMDYYDVSGCYIFRPGAYSIWEAIKDFFDSEIKKLGVQNCYFPMFVSHHALEKEKTHIADFAPEVAWVTKSGDTDLAEPIAIRPTSETVMYPAYAKWIQSYRDLPLKLNQWNNVVRWEFKHPQPFLRTREFLWQEGHTAFATFLEAKEEVLNILDLYRQIYEDLMAIPVIRGRKTEKEKFAGGDYTTTVEAYIASAGRAIQGATSHHLGQNFSHMFEIIYADPETQEKKYVYQNSWGITTRTIGVMIMVHGDNKGLVIPPNVANIQVIIVPCGITVSTKEAERNALQKTCEEYEKQLKDAGVKVKGDYRDNYSPGWKFNHWELKGIPIRFEVGPKDMKNNEFVAVRRDTGEKKSFKKNSVVQEVKSLLVNIQKSLFNKALKERDEHLTVTDSFEEFTSALDKNHMIQAPFCGVEECEDEIKELTKKDVDNQAGALSMGAKSLCIPFNQPGQITKDKKCVRLGCKNAPQFYTMFGRSY